MEVNLIVVEGRRLGEVIPVNRRRFLIGRDESCQLRPRNPAISKQHCALTVRGRTVSVEDMGSTNGTLVNDRCLKNGDKVQVSDGDRLQVGQLIFTIQISAEATGDKDQVSDWLKESPPTHTEPAPNLGSTMILKSGVLNPHLTESHASPEPESVAKPLNFAYRKYDVGRQVASIGLTQDLIGEEKVIRQLRKELFGLAASPQYRRLVLDLKDVEGLTSAACSLLLALARRCKTRGGGLRLCGLQSDVDRVVAALKFESEMGLFENRLAAVADPWP